MKPITQTSSLRHAMGQSAAAFSVIPHGRKRGRVTEREKERERKRKTERDREGKTETESVKEKGKRKTTELTKGVVKAHKKIIKAQLVIALGALS